MSCLIDIDEEKKIYENTFDINIKQNECDKYKPDGINWYITKDLTPYKIDTITNYEAQTMFLDILKNENSILEHCCFHKDFFKINIDNLKIVSIGNIRIKSNLRNKSIVKKLFNNQKKVYFKNDFNFIILNALLEASFIWYKIGFEFVSLEDKQKIEKLFRDYLLSKKDILRLETKDIIKIKLDTAKKEYFNGFRDFLESLNQDKYIPMFQKIKD